MSLFRQVLLPFASRSCPLRRSGKKRVNCGPLWRRAKSLVQPLLCHFSKRGERRGVGWNRIGELIFRFFWHFRLLQAQERAAAEAAKAASRSRPQVTTHLNSTRIEIHLKIFLDSPDWWPSQISMSVLVVLALLTVSSCCRLRQQERGQQPPRQGGGRGRRQARHGQQPLLRVPTRGARQQQLLRQLQLHDYDGCNDDDGVGAVLAGCVVGRIYPMPVGWLLG